MIHAIVYDTMQTVNWSDRDGIRTTDGLRDVLSEALDIVAAILRDLTIDYPDLDFVHDRASITISTTDGFCVITTGYRTELYVACTTTEGSSTRHLIPIRNYKDWHQVASYLVDLMDKDEMSLSDIFAEGFLI